VNRKVRGLQKTVILGLLLATAIILAIFEIYIPRPLPWVKPGLANVVALTAIYLFGLREAIAINCLRVVLVNLLTGGFAGPGFWLALSASFFAAISMFVAIRAGAPKIGPIGVSMLGAFVHVATQLLFAGFFVIGKLQILYLLPLFVLPSFFAGLIVGLLGYLLLLRLQKKYSLRYALPGLGL
jgi:heptaprenyl diphosphate synthase